MGQKANGLRQAGYEEGEIPIILSDENDFPLREAQLMIILVRK